MPAQEIYYISFNPIHTVKFTICWGRTMVFDYFPKVCELWNTNRNISHAKFRFFVGVYMHTHIYVNTYLIVTLVLQPVRL